MLNDRQIIFTSRKVPNNSFYMRGYQMAIALQGLGYNVRCMRPQELSTVSDALIVWVRRCSCARRLRSLSRAGNIHIYDPLDRIDELWKTRVYENINAVIFPSKTQYIQHFNDEKLNDVIKYRCLHHFDPALKPYEHDQFEIGYWGYTTSAVNVRNFVKRENRFTSARGGEYPPESFFKRISCHYSVRDDKRGLGWRPTTKISTAAACGANIILSRDAMSEELLPKDYPYFIEGSGYEDTRRVIDYARNTFNTDTWKYGLACMAKVRRSTSVQRCAKVYSDIIDDLCQRFK